MESRARILGLQLCDANVKSTVLVYRGANIAKRNIEDKTKYLASHFLSTRR